MSLRFRLFSAISALFVLVAMPINHFARSFAKRSPDTKAIKIGKKNQTLVAENDDDDDGEDDDSRVIV